MSASKPLRTFGSALLLVLALLASGQVVVRAQTPGDPAEKGAQLYAQNCAVCHGPDGKGRVGATLAKDWPSIRPDLTVRTIIQNGVPGSPMPAWGQAKGGPLSDEEIDALVAFILAWQTGGAPHITPGPTATRRPPITPVPNVGGDPNQGALLFDSNCVVCHGEKGEGRIGATLAKSWPSIRPDLTIKATIAGGVPGSPMPAWSQVKGGPLTDSEIDDLTAYVQTLAESGAVVQVSPTVIAPASTSSPLLSEWGGVLLTVVLFVAIVMVALILQRRKPQTKDKL